MTANIANYFLYQDSEKISKQNKSHCKYEPVNIQRGS